MKAQLIDSVTEACRNILQFESEVTVEGLIGITLDSSEVILVNINETLKRPVDIVGSVYANMPDVSNAGALTAYLADYFACDIGSGAKLSKRKRHGQPQLPRDSAATVEIDSSLSYIAQQKRRRSESCSLSSAAHVGDGSTSDNYPLTDVSSQSSVTRTVGIITKESPPVSHRRSGRRYRVKLENNESVAHVNSDDGNVRSEQDDSLNTSRLLSADSWQSDNAAAAVANDGDGGGSDLCKTSKQQNSDNPSNHSIAGDSSRLVISRVFSVKQEPIFDCEYRQQSPTLQHSFASECEPPDETQVSQTEDQVTAASQPSPLQVDCTTLLCN